MNRKKPVKPVKPVKRIEEKPETSELPVYTNVLLPFALASASFSTELLTSYPSKVHVARAPSTMYTSAILVVIVLSSPPFLSGMRILHMDRFDPVKMVMVALLLVLVCLSDIGMDEGDRVCSVFLYNIVLMAGVGITYKWNGVPEWTPVPIAPNTETRDAHTLHVLHVLDTTTLQCFRFAIGMILLSGMIILRKSMWLCYDMRSHTDIYVEGSILTGCTTCDAKNAFLLSFTATAAWVTAALAIVRPKLTQSTLALAFSSMLQCICVLCLYITQNQASANMPALFEQGCFVAEQCPVAYEMRRIVASTHATGSSTFLALATIAITGQLLDRSMRAPTQEAQRTLFIIILLTTTAMLAILIVFSVSKFDSFESSIDVALIITLIGIAVGSLFDELLGAMCINAAIAIDFAYHYIHKIGLDVAMTYLTVVSNTTCLLLFVLLTTILVVDRYLIHLSTSMQIVTLCGRSIAWFLAVGSTSLFAVYDGGILPQREHVMDPLLARSAFAFLLWHFAPIIAWLMIARQIPPVNLTRSTQLLFWVSSVLFVGSVYLVALTLNTGTLPSEYPITRLASIAVTLLIVIAPCWLCAL